MSKTITVYVLTWGRATSLSSSFCSSGGSSSAGSSVCSSFLCLGNNFKYHWPLLLDCFLLSVSRKEFHRSVWSVLEKRCAMAFICFVSLSISILSRLGVSCLGSPLGRYFFPFMYDLKNTDSYSSHGTDWKVLYNVL